MIRNYLLLCCILGLFISPASFADNIYKIQQGDFLGKIVSKSYPFNTRINSKQQIMVAILRANPNAFRGGNIHFLKKVSTLVLPAKNVIALIAKDEAITIVKAHYKFFKKKKTGNFPAIPLQYPAEKNTTLIDQPKKKDVAMEEEDRTKKQTPHTVMKKKSETTALSVKSEAKKIEEDAKFLSPVTCFQEEYRFASQWKIFDGEKQDKVKCRSYFTHILKKIIVNKKPPISSKKTWKEISTEITVYNWENFLPDDILKRFTEETGIKVNYFTYSNNKVMYAKMKAFKGKGYDVVISSAPFVKKLYQSGLIQALDHRKLKNLKHLNPKLLNPSYDPNNAFSIPYLLGSTGIGFNTDKLGDIKITSWKDLWSRRWKERLLLKEGMRDMFSIALKLNGHSINTKNPDEIAQAYRLLRKLIPNIKKIAPEQEIKSQFLKRKTNLGILWSSDAMKIQAKNQSFQYIYPKEGAIFWVESFMIPAKASNVDSAHVFIDYMLRPEIAVRCMEVLKEMSPNLKAMSLLENSQNPIVFPSIDLLEDIEFKGDIGKAETLYRLYWRKFKQQIPLELNTQREADKNPNIF